MPITYDDHSVVKRPNLKMPMTNEQVREIIKCTKDVIYFAEKYFTIVGKKGKEVIKLREYQKRMLKEFSDNRFTISNIGRQMGKTTTVDIYVLHHALFNEDQTIAILANKAEMAKSILAEIKMAYENLPSFLKLGVKEYNTFSVEFENGSKLMARATHINAIRGESPNIVIVDEAAHVLDSVAEDFYTSNYPSLSSTGGKMIMISTPKGTANLFYRLWKDAIDKKNNFKPIKVEWWENPERDENWKIQTIKDIGIIRFNQEFNCIAALSVINILHKPSGKIITTTIEELYEKGSNILQDL